MKQAITKDLWLVMDSIKLDYYGMFPNILSTTDNNINMKRKARHKHNP